MQSFRFFHSFITINSIVMPTHRKSTGTTPFDPQTLGELYETYAPQLLRICLRYIKNQAEAEDVLHDAFVIIFTHIDHLRDETKLVHWMTVIVRNLALRQAKATEERRRLREAMTEELADDDSPPSSSVIPMERLLEAIETLPRGYGEVFRLAVLDGLSHEEIGQLLGIAPHSSSSQLARAKRLLRKLLADYRLLLILPVVVGVWIYRQHSMRRKAAPSTAALPRPLPQKAMPPVGRKGALPVESARRGAEAKYTAADSKPTPPKCSMTSAMQAQSSAPLTADRLRFAALSAPLPNLSQSGDTVVLPTVVAPIADRQLAMDVHIPSPVARKHYPWTVNFGGGAATASSNSPIKFDYLSLTVGHCTTQFVVATGTCQTPIEKALGRLPTAPYLAGGGGRLDLQAAQHAPESGTFDGRPASPSSSKGDASRGTQGCASGRKRKARSRSQVYRSRQQANATEVFHDFSDASAIVRATHRRSSQICRALRSASQFVAKRRHRCAADCRRPNRRSTVGNGCSYPLTGCSQALSLDCEFRWRSGHSFFQFAHQVRLSLPHRSRQRRSETQNTFVAGTFGLSCSQPNAARLSRTGTTQPHVVQQCTQPRGHTKPQ